MQVVAHFGASWCVTSLSMNYKFEELAQTHPEILFLFVDVDDVQVINHPPIRPVLSLFCCFIHFRTVPMPANFFRETERGA